MNAGEHPEALLDRALAGDLETAEGAALDEHLAACAACALHLAFGTNVRTGTAAARDEALNRVAIAGALSRAQAPRPWFGWRIGWPVRLALASVLLVGGLAGAAVTLRVPRTAQKTALAKDVATAPKTVAEARAAPVAAAAQPAAAAVEPLAPEPAAVPPAADHPAPREVPTAAALFTRAHDLRRQGRVERAIETYRLLQQRYPHTREASLSFALAGRLQLEVGRPAQALAEFDRYLTVGTEIANVAEEALAGRAEALRRLGRHREEADAWRALLARFPGSIYAGQAHARLAK